MRRGRIGCLWMILKPVVLLATIVAVLAIVAFPWGIPLPGRDTLTGEWVGEVRSSSGPHAWLYMNLQIARRYTQRMFGGRTRLGDDAALCTSRRRIALSIAGYTTAWSGKGVDLLLEPVRPSPPALRFDVLGTWDGHTLELKESGRSLADALNEPGNTTAAESTQWIAATLKRGTRSQFDSTCGVLAPGK